MGVNDTLEFSSCNENITCEMAMKKSVTFSHILELASDEVSVGSSETDLFPSVMKFEPGCVYCWFVEKRQKIRASN